MKCDACTYFCFNKRKLSYYPYLNENACEYTLQQPPEHLHKSILNQHLNYVKLLLLLAINWFVINEYSSLWI